MGESLIGTVRKEKKGQSWTCIHVYNFRPIHPILTNKLSVDSLIQAEFNAPYVVINGFSAILVYVKNLQNASLVTNAVQSSRNGTDDLQAMLDLLNRFFKFRTVWSRQPTASAAL